MNRSSFSILMSLYDGESETNLEQCLQSIAEQTLIPDEIIIVFDGVIRVELVRICQEYSKILNVIIIKLPHNVGLGKALNIGLTHCSNEIIARMDTDDICLPRRFELQIKSFVKDDLDLVGSSIVEFDDANNRREKKLPITFDEIKEFSKKKNPFNHMTVVFKKTSVLSVGSYKHHYYMEDYNLWLRMIAKNMKVANLNEVTVDARVGISTIYKRRGWGYICSEVKLFLLKRRLGLTGSIDGLLIALLRIAVRILPVSVLRVIYNFDRK